MQVFLAGPLPDNARNLMRRLGYGEHIGHGGQISFSRRLTGSDFPRYHAYVEDKNGGMQINLHLDQKPSNLGSGAMHGGEYEGPLIENEMARLRRMIASFSPSQVAPLDSARDLRDEKKGFFSKIFNH